MFYSKYKRKNPNYVLEVFVKLCVESFVEVFTFIHTHRVIKIKIHVKNLMISKHFKKDLKPLNGVSKSQVGELVVVANQRKM